VKPEDRPSLPRSGHCMVALPPEHPDDVLLFGGCAPRLSNVARLSTGAPAALDWRSSCLHALAGSVCLFGAARSAKQAGTARVCSTRRAPRRLQRALRAWAPVGFACP